MFDIINKKMEQLLNKNTTVEFKNLNVDISGILNIYNSDFLLINDCIFMECLVSKKLVKLRFVQEDWLDFSREDFENHFHLSSLLYVKSITKKELISYSLLITDIFRIKLSRSFPEKNFAITAQLNLSNSNLYNDARISFYQINKDEFDIEYYIGDNFSELSDPMGVCIV